MGTVDPRAVGRVWVQLSSPMQDSGENVKCAMWVVVKHFEKFPRLFAGQLICVNVLPHMSPEWCMYSQRAAFYEWEGHYAYYV